MSKGERQKSLKILKKKPNEMCMDQECHQYCGSPVSVPFMWESQPGTPKSNTFKNNPQVPPLTPPPSYYFSDSKSRISNSKSSSLLTHIFLRPKKSRKSTPSSSSSSPSSVPSSPVVARRLSVRGSSRSRTLMVDEEEHECESPVSTLCFEIGRGGNGRCHGCYASIIKLLIA